MTKIINLQNPTEIVLKATSPIADFRTHLGWTDEVSINLLPPYDSTKEDLIKQIKMVMTSFDVVPFDNRADCEHDQHLVTKVWEKFVGHMERLDDILASPEEELIEFEFTERLTDKLPGGEGDESKELALFNIKFQQRDTDAHEPAYETPVKHAEAS